MPFERTLPDLLLLDTGPIRELVLFRAVEELGFERLRKDLRFLRDRSSYRTCGQFISSFRQRRTSAGVVVELNSWIRSTEARGRERIWRLAYEEFKDIEEHLIRLRDLQVGWVAKCGPVDMSLLELACLTSAQRAVILTVDNKEPFATECRRRNVTVKLLQDVIA